MYKLYVYWYRSETNGITEHKHYLQAGGMVFAMQVTRTGSLAAANSAIPGGNQASSLRYFHHDHLGSVAAVTDGITGAVIERLAYDPWGKRRYPNGTADTSDALLGLTTDRGYTEHEHIDEMGLINMNGRIYDPLIGRFMSADPHIQAPYNLKSFNRYSYVWNNPLKMVDRSGFEGESESTTTTDDDDDTQTNTPGWTTPAATTVENPPPSVPPVDKTDPNPAAPTQAVDQNANSSNSTQQSVEQTSNIQTTAEQNAATQNNRETLYAQNDVADKNPGVRVTGYGPNGVGIGGEVAVGVDKTVVVTVGVGAGGGIVIAPDVTLPGAVKADGTIGVTYNLNVTLGPVACKSSCNVGLAISINPQTESVSSKYYESCKSECSASGKLGTGLNLTGNIGFSFGINGRRGQ